MRRARTPSRVPAPEDDLAAARDLGIDTCGRIAEFWGFTRTMGRAFGLLYLSPDPLTQAELQKRLGISAGSASMTLAGPHPLGRGAQGVGQGRTARSLPRRDRLLEDDLGRAQRARAARNHRRGGAGRPTPRPGFAPRARVCPASKRPEIDFTSQRLARLGEICRLGEVMLDMLLGNLKLDVGQIPRRAQIVKGIMRSTVAFFQFVLNIWKRLWRTTHTANAPRCRGSVHAGRGPHAG